MRNIDKQWLQQKIAGMEARRADPWLGLDEDDSNTLAALRIALASLEAEAVAYADPQAFHNFSVYRAGETDNKHMGREWMWANPDAGLIPVYTAPTAPVSVPDDVMAAMQKVARIRLDLNDFDGDKRGILDCLGDAEEALIEVVNRRAAMLQGAENAETPTTMQTAPSLDSSQKIAESPVGINQGKTETVTTACKWRDAVETIRNSGIAIDAEKIFAERDALNAPDCWCHTCRPVKISDMRLVVCPDCGNKRCPHANDHRHACTGSNEPGQEWSAYPASLQQEVK